MRPDRTPPPGPPAGRDRLRNGREPRLRRRRLADPEALPLAVATQQAVEFVGLPEARIPLAHAVCYMSRAPKNREAYEALNAATERIESEQTKRVPEKLKNKHFPVNPKR